MSSLFFMIYFQLNCLTKPGLLTATLSSFERNYPHSKNQRQILHFILSFVTHVDSLKLENLTWPDTILGSCDPAVNKADKNLFLHGAYLVVLQLPRGVLKC